MVERAEGIIALAIRETYGDRCSDYESDCMCCQAWRQYDRLSAQQREPVVKQLDSEAAGIKPGPSENFDSSLMEAVRKAKARVDTWSDAKKDYASRALASSDPASGRSQPSPDVSVDELARVIADEIGICVDDDKSGVWINCHPAARAILARYRIGRLDRLASGRR